MEEGLDGHFPLNGHFPDPARAPLSFLALKGEHLGLSGLWFAARGESSKTGISSKAVGTGGRSLRLLGGVVGPCVCQALRK